MAIGYVGGNTAGFVGSAATPVTVALNSGLTGGSSASVSANDLVVVVVSFGTNGGAPTCAVSTPSGYSTLTVQRENAGTYDTSHQVSYKFMGGTPDTSVDIPPSGNIQWAGTYAIHVYSGVDLTTPLDVAAVYATGTGTGQANPPAITPTTAGAWIVAAGSGADPTGATYTSSDLSGFITSVGNDNIDSMVGLGYYSSWTSGAFNPAQFGGGTTSASDSWVATTMALRPASGGGVTVKPLAALGVG